MSNPRMSDSSLLAATRSGPFDIGHLVVRSLKEAGVREIFGIPGDFVLPLFKVIEDSAELPLFTLSHEPSVGFAADGAARCACRPSAAVVTYGAGALNMVNPIAAAYAEKVPVVVVSGGPGLREQHADLLLHHQAKRLDSQRRIYEEITCDQTRLDDSRTAPAELSRVLSTCLEQSRPVYIEVPRDQVFVPCSEPEPLARNRRCDPQAIEACTAEILAILRRATAPVLMVGVEIRRLGIENQVAELARRLGIPVVTSFMGRGLLSAKGVSVAGTYLGVAGDPAVSDLVENADALMLLGVILSDTNLGMSRRKLNLSQCILAHDRQVRLGYHVYQDLPLDALVESLLVRTQQCIAPNADPRSDRASPRRMLPFAADETPLVPRDIARGINELVHRVGPQQIVADVGDALFIAMDIDGELAAPGYYASMGYAVPAGLGIQAATGKRPIILVGDGAFQMTGWELGNSSRYDLDPIVVVINNSGWEMLRAFAPDSKFNDLESWKFSELATALGGEGVRVQTQVQWMAALDQAFYRRGRFQLIEVMIERGSMSPTMARYVQGLSGRDTNN